MSKVILNDTNNFKPYKCIIFMAAFFIMLDMCCILFANKIISLPLGNTFAVTVISAISFMTIDIIAEVYGYKMSMIFFVLSSFSKFIIFLYINFMISFNSIHIDDGFNQYNIVLRQSNLITIVAFFDFLLITHINSYLIIKWKILMRGKYFWLRSVGSSAIAETLFVLLPIPIWTWFKHYNYSDISIIFIISSCAYRILFTAIAAFPSTIIVAILKKIENVDVHAPMQNFNPFLKEAGLHKDKNF